MSTTAGPDAARLTRAATPPRSLADDLRRRGDDELAALLRARPDLAAPLPHDIATLAVRAASRASVQRALEHLDRFAHQVLDAIRVLPEPASAAAVGALVGEPEGAQDVLGRLWRQALVWGEMDALHLVGTVDQALGPEPAGVGPPLAEALAGVTPSRAQEYLADLGLPPTHDAVSALAAISAHQRDAAWMDRLLAQAPGPARAALDALAWGPPTGQVRGADRPVRAETARGGVEWLLARALVIPVDAQTVVLPLEVALHLRGGHLHRVVETAPPVPETTTHDPGLVDRAAAGQAFTALRLVAEVAEWCAATPPTALRGGGLGVRELRRLAVALDVAEPEAAFWAELAYTAGLVAQADDVWLPTPGYDTWLAAEPAARWTLLAGHWAVSSRVPALAGERDTRNQPLAALGPQLDRAAMPPVRAEVLRALADLPAGAAVTAPQLLPVLEWRRPLLAGSQRRQLVEWSLHEAALLGVTGRGALAGFVRPLAAAAGPGVGSDLAAAWGGSVRRSGAALRQALPEWWQEVAQQLAGLLPEPLDHVLLQADLTAVAPGPLVPELARELGLMADVESTGGATVYRFTADSVRRALDAGRSPAGLLDLLRGGSRTPVPQALEYLVMDAARRHGQVRVGSVAAYIRCEDEAALSEVLADRRTAELGLRRIAPTVAVTAAAPRTVLESLRAAGHAPVAEAPGGEVLIHRQDARRTGPRLPPQPVSVEPPPVGDAAVRAAVRAMRSGERAASAAPPSRTPGPGEGGIPRMDTAATLRLLRDAVDGRQAVWISYVNAEGHASQWVIEPVGVNGGYVTAIDPERDELLTFTLHRIAGAAPAGDGAVEGTR